MSDSDSNFVDPNTDDLDAFNTLLNGHSQPLEDTNEAATFEEEIVEDNADAEEDLENDTLETEDETDDEGGSEDEEGDEPEPDPKPVKKNRVQERIDDLTREKYEEKRRADALEAKLDAILAEIKPKTIEPAATEATFDGPNPDALNEDGTEKYPLGEFDPAYIRDLTRHTIAQETEAARIAAEEKAKATEEEAAKTQLIEEWDNKLTTAEEKYPDLRIKNIELVDTFDDLDPAYGEYLANTIMSMEHGTDVLYYLANNLDEARRIAASGPMKATLSLGRIEARYDLQHQEQKERKLKVSTAPTPPPQINKGAASVSSVAPDTDDLDAFETLLFQKKKGR